MGESIMNSQLSLLEPVRQQMNDVKGNTHLVNYGIQTETSDYHVHIAYLSQHAYIFPTKVGIALVMQKGHNQSKDVFMNASDGRKLKTAKGFPVGVGEFSEMQEVLIPSDVHQKNQIHFKMSTTMKGQIAVKITLEMLKRHLINLPLDVNEINDKTLQIQGSDIIVKMNTRLQVKCDFQGGSKKYNKFCTGNLFLQTHECNPFRKF